MKNIITLLLLAASFTSYSQTLPNQSVKPEAIIKPSPIYHIPCSGGATPKGIDLKWKPILSVKDISVEHDAPNQEYIDSVKDYKLQLKREYEKHIKLSGAKTTTVLPTVGTNFSGYLCDGSQPLDNSIAVSNGGIIVSVENRIITYASTSGAPLLGGANLSDFLAPYYTLANSVCDPVVLYDPNYDRFIFFCQEYNSTSGLFHNNRIFVCFSKTNNPFTGGWWYYSFTGDPTGTGDGFDYPKLAINDSELFITGNLFTIGTPSTFHRAVIFQMDKRAGYSGATISGVHWTGMTTNPSTLLPVSWGQNGDITTGMILVSTNNYGGDSVHYFRIYGNWCCVPTMTYNGISTTTYSPAGNAFQLGTTTLLHTNDCRALSGFYLNGIIHFTFNSDYSSGYCGLNYNRLDLTTLTNTSIVAGASGYDFAYPSVASFAPTTTTDKSVMIGFGLTSSTMYPEIGVINCDDAMTFSAYTNVHAGASYVQYSIGDTLDRWGDYTGMARFHSSPTPSVWMNGMFGYTSNKWQTWIAEIHGSGTTCTAPTSFSVTAITSTSATLNWGGASGAASYNVSYRAVGTIPWTTTSTSLTWLVVSGLSPSTLYEYQVQTVCTGTGTTSFSASTNFTTLPTSTTTLNSISTSDYKLFPNPVINSFTVEFPLSENTDLNIFIIDVNGRLVKELYNGKATFGDNVFSFDKSNLSIGVYFLIVKTPSDIIRKYKIVIAN